ncbi:MULTISPECIES: DUF4190 domain-containing protein [unclassified Nocardioides]|uniref:DUF4190 domain-containing protein n=1 Tax=unclassified Nocardioides TaxID=2615069 RepID=UPI0006FB0454|nr:MULTISPECIES: DUF4190 domain-containing protein [unclassified Nocardioides]KRA28191.1 hypothetical protein ASD81_23890 [Nocardioides sp. Root614]KRA86165.1 hypothetical protein ASD84_24130 [Nocardioides sp. Root682]
MTTPTWGQQPDEQPLPPPQQQPYAPYGQPVGQPVASPYGQPVGPPQPYVFTPPRPTNGMAIASLIVSILSLSVCVGATGFIGAILGHMAKGQIRRNDEQGGGIATAGILVGWAGFAIFVIGGGILVALLIWAGESVDDYCYTDSSGTYVCD